MTEGVRRWALPLILASTAGVLAGLLVEPRASQPLHAARGPRSGVATRDLAPASVAVPPPLDVGPCEERRAEASAFVRRWGVAPGEPPGWGSMSAEELAASVDARLEEGDVWDADCTGYPCIVVGFTPRVDPRLEGGLRSALEAPELTVHWLEAWVEDGGERRSGFRFVATVLHAPLEDEDARLYVTRVGQALLDRHVVRERAALEGGGDVH